MNENSYLNILKENNVKKQFESNLFIPKIGEKYYYINDWWNLHNDYEDAIRTDTREEYETEDIIFVRNKVSRTLEEAVEHYKFLKAEAELKLAIAKINKEWTPDWNNENQPKFYIYYNHSNNKFNVSSAYRYNFNPNIIYLKDDSDAQTMINLYSKELKTYFGVLDEQ